MPGIYRIEASPNRRAGCQATECKKAGVKIQAGELRFGTFVTIQEHQSWRWKHWGCVTPQQVSNLKDSVEDNLEAYLDGYEDLDEHDKARVAKATEEGHVADEDWKGDVEVNRPGQKGYRTPASKKAAKEQARAEKETAEDRDDSPSAPAERKKRHRAKKEADAEDDGQPAPKKAKASAKKGGNVKIEHDADGEVQPKKSLAKTAKPKLERKPRQTIKAEDDGENVIAQIPTKKPRASRRAAPKKVKSEDVDTEDGGPYAEAPGSDEASEAKDDDVDFDEETPKVKKTRKPAIKRETKGTAARSRLATDSKQKADVASGATERAKRANGRARRS